MSACAEVHVRAAGDTDIVSSSSAFVRAGPRTTGSVVLAVNASSITHGRSAGNTNIVASACTFLAVARRRGGIMVLLSTKGKAVLSHQCQMLTEGNA